MLDKNLHPNLIKKMSKIELEVLAKKIRSFLIDLANKKEIHLSSNLGIVEISISLASHFEFDKDKIIYDTGHQTYVHKILTGRINELINLRTNKSMGGIQTYNQTIFDHYGGGHSGNSLSIISGFAITKNNRYCVCVIGDSALNTGLSFEALNYIGGNNIPVIIILNDNDMSIGEATGALRNHLNHINNKENYFTNLGFNYFGIYDGHNFDQINQALLLAKEKVRKNPVILHFKTKKGRGLIAAENDRIGAYHSCSLQTKVSLKFGDIAYKNLTQKIKNNKNI